MVSSSLVAWDSKGATLPDASVLLSPEETHHLRNVLRIKAGSLCLLYDSRGREFLGRLEGFRDNAQAEFKLLEPSRGGSRTAPTSETAVATSTHTMRLSVAQAIPQDRKMDRIVEKSAELGVFQLIPLITERTVVRIRRDQFPKVCQRWERIALQTLKQSRVSAAPRISPPTSFEAMCSDLSRYHRTFLLHPSSGAMPFRDAFVGVRHAAPLHTLLIIGPEGGFSPSEVERASRAGAKIVTLGAGILKTDTAFVAAASFLKLTYGD